MDHQSSHANLATFLCLSLGEDNPHIGADGSFHMSGHDGKEVDGTSAKAVAANANVPAGVQGANEPEYIVVYESFDDSEQQMQSPTKQLIQQHNGNMQYNSAQNEEGVVVFEGYTGSHPDVEQPPNTTAPSDLKGQQLQFLSAAALDGANTGKEGGIKPCDPIMIDMPSIDTVIQRVVQGDLPENCVSLVQVEPEMFTEEPHMLIRAGPKANQAKTASQFSCQFCGKKFVENRTLQRHIMIHKNDRPHRCETCDKAFILVGDLRRHMRIHNGERPYACKLCGKTFILKGNLIQHFRTHTPDKQYSCAICRKTYAHKESLHRHIRGHFGEKPYECTSCGKRFLLKADLNRHILVHSDKKPFACETCGRQFAMKGNLRQHLKSRCHSGRPAHKVPIIVTVKKADPRDADKEDENFECSSNDGSPSVHTNITNPSNPQIPEKPMQEEMFPVELCESVPDVCSQEQVISTDRQNSPLKENAQVDVPKVNNQEGVENNEATCSICHKTFANHASLQRHFLSVHEEQSGQGLLKGKAKYACHFCGKEFALKGDLKRHLDYHNGIKPFRCEYCTKTFTLKSNLVQHYTTHRQDKPYNCPMCNKAFSNQRNMKLHLRRHEMARANFVCTNCGLSFLSKSDHFFHECVKGKPTTTPASMSESSVALTVEVLTSGFSTLNENSDSDVVVPTVEELSNANITVMSTNSASRLKKEVERFSCANETAPENFNNTETAAAVNGIQSLLSRMCHS